MRRVALVAAVLLAGCFDAPSPGPPTGPPPPCADPCERPIAGSDAFEPWVVADPDDPDRLLAADTPFRGNTRQLRLHVSSDGGHTWSTTEPDLAGSAVLDGCEQVVDPQTAFLPNGDLVATAIALRGDLSRQLFSLVSRDGGATWEGPHAIEPEAGGGCGGRSVPDFDRLVALPDGRLLLTWRHLVLQESVVTFASESGIGFATSQDGVDWSDPATLSVTGHPLCLRASVGPIPHVGQDGSVVIAAQYWSPVGNLLCAVHSADLRTGSAAFLGEVGLAWPDLARQGEDLLVLAAAPGTPETPVLWRSADGGSTWTGPARLDDLASDGATTPSLAADGEGTVWITAYRLQGSQWSYWGGQLEGDRVVDLVRLDRSPIGEHGMGIQGMGHYVGLAGLDRGAFAAWVAGTEGNRTLVGATLR